MLDGFPYNRTMSDIETNEENAGYKTYAYFYVCDFAGEAIEITRLLELEPTKTWLKGDAWYHPQRPRAESNWEIHSPVDCSEIFLDTHIEAVLNIIEPKRAQIAQLQAKGYTAGINCVGYYYGTHPGFGLSAKLLSRLAAFQMDVDFDLYCLCANDDEEQKQESSES